MESILPFSGRRAVVLGGLALLACLCLAGNLARAQNTPTASANPTSDAANAEGDKAWKETKKLTQPPMPPAAWQQQQPSREEVAKFYTDALMKAANAAKDFYTKFPNHPKAEEARQ
ncbi:MAG TPA: hypothetical protein VG754_08395, partial [Verrucomicrobiae bacterium]|nr:hypothetical protein [Verrucomicrobiae bacterium]